MRLAEYLDILTKTVLKEGSSSANKDYLEKIISLACKNHTNLAYPWKELQHETSISTVDGTSEYYLANDLDLVKSIWHEEYESYQPIPIISSDKFYGSKLSTTLEGTPQIAVLNKKTGVTAQPTSASALTIYSNDSDDKSKNVRIYGIVSGFPDKETITTNSSDGTTTSSGSKLFSRVDATIKDSATDGILTIEATPTVIAQIPAGSSTFESKYTSFILHPTPDSAITIKYLFKRKQYSLVDDNDFSILSDDHDYAILLLSEYFTYKDFNTYKLYLEQLKLLKSKEPAIASNSNIMESRSSLSGMLPFLRMGDWYEYPIYPS